MLSEHYKAFSLDDCFSCFTMFEKKNQHSTFSIGEDIKIVFFSVFNT